MTLCPEQQCVWNVIVCNFLLQAVRYRQLLWLPVACFSCVLLYGCYVLATSPNIELHTMQWSPALFFFFLPLFTAVEKVRYGCWDSSAIFRYSMYFLCTFYRNMFSLTVCRSRALVTSLALSDYERDRKEKSCKMPVGNLWKLHLMIGKFQILVFPSLTVYC